VVRPSARRQVESRTSIRLGRMFRHQSVLHLNKFSSAARSFLSSNRRGRHLFFAAILALTSLHSIQSERYLSISMVTIEPLRSKLGPRPALEIEDAFDRRDVVTDKLGFSSCCIVGAYGQAKASRFLLTNSSTVIRLAATDFGDIVVRSGKDAVAVVDGDFMKVLHQEGFRRAAGKCPWIAVHGYRGVLSGSLRASAVDFRVLFDRNLLVRNFLPDHAAEDRRDFWNRVSAACICSPSMTRPSITRASIHHEPKLFGWPL
jgi:hypothetical protein